MFMQLTFSDDALDLPDRSEGEVQISTKAESNRVLQRSVVSHGGTRPQI